MSPERKAEVTRVVETGDKAWMTGEGEGGRLRGFRPDKETHPSAKTLTCTAVFEMQGHVTDWTPILILVLQTHRVTVTRPRPELP